MGVAHIMLYKKKNEEIKHKYTTESEGFTESMNPKDKDFIYF